MKYLKLVQVHFESVPSNYILGILLKQKQKNVRVQIGTEH